MTVRPVDPSVYALEYSPDGRFLATGHFGGDVSVWEARTGRQLATLKGHKGRLFSLAFSPDGRTLATGGAFDDHAIMMWEIPATTKTVAEK